MTVKLKTKKPKEAVEYSKFLLRIPVSQRNELSEIAGQYRRVTGLKVTAAFLLRLAWQELVPKLREDLERAQGGSYHAKIRKNIDRLSP
jgi:hypothetical protein